MASAESAVMFKARNREMSIEGDTLALVFDILINESHSWRLRPATHPVQEGSPITDHIYKELRTASVNGLITNFGLKRGSLDSNYAQDAFDKFEYYRDNVTVVTIVTSLKVYEEYVITGVSAVRDGRTGEAQAFAITFQEYRTVKLRETSGVSISVSSTDLSSDADAQQASPNADVGEQAAEDPNATESGKLERFFNFTDFAEGAYN